MTQIVLPFISVPDPTKDAPLFNAQLFFGLPDEDPEVEANQKLVSAIQENGDLISIPQPVRTNAGGVPEFQGSSVRLDISGDYSYKVLDRFGDQVYFVPNVENPDTSGNGTSFSGIVAEENTTLTSDQTTVILTSLGANESVFYLQSKLGDQGFLAKDIDYTIINSTTIELAQSYNNGDVIVARQNDPTGQLIPVNEVVVNLLVFVDVADAQNNATLGNIVEGDTFTLNGDAAEGDGLGGIKYIAILTTESNDDVNFINLNGTLQMALESNYHRLKNYSETIAVPLITAGTLNIDLDQGSSQEITMVESASDVTFVNFNPSALFSSTVTLKTTQDGTGSHGITWPSNIKWAGGVAPTLTSDPDAIDMFGFTTYNAGVDWFGFTMGQDFS